MIIFYDDYVHGLMRYLDKYYPRKEKVYLRILEGYDCIETPNGEMGFAVFDTDSNCIYVPGEVPEEAKDMAAAVLITSVAHEYMHFMQKCDGKPYDEDEANDFSCKIMNDIPNIQNGGLIE